MSHLLEQGNTPAVFPKHMNEFYEIYVKLRPPQPDRDRLYVVWGMRLALGAGVGVG